MSHFMIPKDSTKLWRWGAYIVVVRAHSGELRSLARGGDCKAGSPTPPALAGLIQVDCWRSWITTRWKSRRILWQKVYICDVVRSLKRKQISHLKQIFRAHQRWTWAPCEEFVLNCEENDRFLLGCFRSCCRRIRLGNLIRCNCLF